MAAASLLPPSTATELLRELQRVVQALEADHAACRADLARLRRGPRAGSGEPLALASFAATAKLDPDAPLTPCVDDILLVTAEDGAPTVPAASGGAAVDACASKAVSASSSFNESYDVNFYKPGRESKASSVVSASTEDGEESVPEPPLCSCAGLKKMLESTSFEAVIGGLILVNTAVMAVEMQYYGIGAGYSAKYPTISVDAVEWWPSGAYVLEVLERTFTIIFTLELVLRICVLRCQVCLNPINWIDIVAVFVSLLDWLATTNQLFNPMVVRLLRLLKLTRGLRMAKFTKVLGSLHLLLKAISASASTLSWSLLLLLLLQAIVAMIATQICLDYVSDDANALESRQQVFAYYGTFTRSMITMFEVHLANFAPACRVLLNNLGEQYAYFFITYRCVAGFAILNVINAVFIQQTMKVAQQDLDIMLAAKQKEKDKYSNDLKHLFKRMDRSGDGKLTLEELKGALQEPQLKTWMHALEIDAHDIEGLFHTIDVNGDGEITASELILGASRIKGSAKSIDIVHLLAETRKIEEKVDLVRHAVVVPK
eukprot:TRINITY_DN23098_c0_g2_i1.p1 TRINITY_DN23098_c0_g2~~TRINITY_DN23098_c0_g2_i1.p1  ORF type:complete len:611 (-),score=123.11 TRINITY_DN23098_c0_g2_i1:70-1701(-)